MPVLIHYTGTFQCPGGHLEHGESFATTAAREVLEETGLVVGNIKFLTATNDVFEGEGKHYITIFVTAEIVGEEKTPRVSLPSLRRTAIRKSDSFAVYDANDLCSISQWSRTSALSGIGCRGPRCGSGQANRRKRRKRGRRARGRYFCRL
jgi:ADP-ribose pyrophosphatase YjhB (NUDIX family)